MNYDTKLINLWAGPGAGKSTMAAGIFTYMKQRGVSCEYVQEYAKELTWNKDWDVLRNSLLVAGTQINRVKQLIGKVDYIVTDSPPLLSTFYTPVHATKAAISAEYYTSIYPFVDTLDVFVERQKTYFEEGRTQSEDEAKRIDEEIAYYLVTQLGDDYVFTTGDKDGLEIALRRIQEEYGVFNIR